MLGKLKVSPRNSPSNLIDQLFPRESKICRLLISRIALMLRPQAAEKTPNFVLGSRKSSTGTRPPHQLGGAHRLGAPYSSHRAPQRVRLRFSFPCGLVGCLFEQPVRPQSNFHPDHPQGMGLGCLRLRASDEHSLIVRVPRAKKAPSLIPTASRLRLTTHRVDLRLRLFVGEATDP
jgi:hypothetical protein